MSGGLIIDWQSCRSLDDLNGSIGFFIIKASYNNDLDSKLIDTEDIDSKNDCKEQSDNYTVYLSYHDNWYINSSIKFNFDDISTHLVANIAEVLSKSLSSFLPLRSFRSISRDDYELNQLCQLLSTSQFAAEEIISDTQFQQQANQRSHYEFNVPRFSGHLQAMVELALIIVPLMTSSKVSAKFFMTFSNDQLLISDTNEPNSRLISMNNHIVISTHVRRVNVSCVGSDEKVEAHLVGAKLISCLFDTDPTPTHTNIDCSSSNYVLTWFVYKCGRQSAPVMFRFNSWFYYGLVDFSSMSTPLTPKNIPLAVAIMRSQQPQLSFCFHAHQVPHTYGAVIQSFDRSIIQEWLIEEQLPGYYSQISQYCSNDDDCDLKQEWDGNYFIFNVTLITEFCPFQIIVSKVYLQEDVIAVCVTQINPPSLSSSKTCVDATIYVTLTPVPRANSNQDLHMLDASFPCFSPMTTNTDSKMIDVDVKTRQSFHPLRVSGSNKGPILAVNSVVFATPYKEPVREIPSTKSDAKSDAKMSVNEKSPSNISKLSGGSRKPHFIPSDPVIQERMRQMQLSSSSSSMDGHLISVLK